MYYIHNIYFIIKPVYNLSNATSAKVKCTSLALLLLLKSL